MNKVITPSKRKQNEETTDKVITVQPSGRDRMTEEENKKIRQWFGGSNKEPRPNPFDLI
jgi:hypothetical protein